MQQQFVSIFLFALSFFLKHQISDQELSNAEVCGLEPKTKGVYYYRKIFEEMFPGCEHLISYYRMPKLSDATDPAATVLLTTSDSTRCYEWNLH